MPKLILGVGYNSGHPYPARPDGGPNYYSRWRGILNRCYGESQPEQYRGCTVAEIWHDFQNFAAWMYQNDYTTPSGEPLALDKDIVRPGNKVYSPENCLLVPTRLNNFFVGSGFDRRTHAELAHGIQVSARHFVTGKVTKLGRYESLEEARKAWAAYKNKHLKSVVIPWYIGQVIPEHIDNHMVFKVIQVLRSYEFK